MLKNYRCMMIAKDNIMPLIEQLAKAYNQTDDDYVVLTTNKVKFYLFDEVLKGKGMKNGTKKFMR